MPSSSVTVQLGTAAAAQEQLEPIFQLYYETFSKPPYQWPEGEETAFRQRLPRLAADPTFAIATAQADDNLIAFVYGYALRPNTTWWDGFATPVAEGDQSIHTPVQRSA